MQGAGTRHSVSSPASRILHPASFSVIQPSAAAKMLRRIVRSLATFIAIFAVYQAYARVAVPWMEPPLKATRRHVPTTAEKSAAAQAASQYQLLLSNYFPKDHWSQTRPPKVITSADETGMLVVDDWK